MMNLHTLLLVLMTSKFSADVAGVGEKDENERTQALCSTADDTYTKIFNISENSATDTLIGMIDVQGVSAPGPSKNIELALVDSDEQHNCGKDGKTCLSWLQLDLVTKSLRLRVEPGYILDRDGPDGVQAINAMLNCTVTLGTEKGQQVQMAISVIVEDVNDNSPAFEDNSITKVVSELFPVNSTVLNVEASDIDKISKRSYSILPSNDSHYFYIKTPHAAVISLKEKLDYEKLVKTSSVLFFVVLVEDEGSKGIIRNATVDVEVIVTDGDDQLPVFQPCITIGKLCVSPEFTARVARDANPGDIITNIRPGKIYAIDPDRDLLVPSKIRYSLLASSTDRSTSSQYFSVGEEDGVLSLIHHLPSKEDYDEYSLYIKAAQLNDEEACQVTKLTIKVVDKVTDVYAPEFSHKNLQGFVHAESESEILFVRSMDGTLLRLVATDQDYVNTNFVPALKFESVNLSLLFEITDDGFILYKRYNDALINGFPFVLTVRVTNPEAVAEFTKSSGAIRVTIESNNIYEECNVLGCGVKKSDPEQQLVSVAALAVVGSFLVLSVLAGVVLLTLVVKYRRRREALGNRPLVDSISNNSKYHELGVTNGLATSLSGSSGASNRMNSNPVLSQTGNASKIKSKQSTPSKKYVASSRKTSAQNVTDESPSIAPYDTHHRFVSDSTNTSLYTPNNDVGGWAAFSIEESLHFEQLSLTEQMAQSKHKIFYKGHIALSDTLKRDCFVARYSGTYSHKDNTIQDLWAMQEILNVKSCSHINLVKFFGCCSNKGKKTSWVMKWMEIGVGYKGKYLMEKIDDSLYVVSEIVNSANDLRSTLRASRIEDHASMISSLSGTQLANFATAIADGLQYLHANEICHGNICARTVLLSEQLIPKLRGCCGHKNSRLRKKTLRWAAPEILIGNSYTTASDVWAYAVLVWEILTIGGLPYWTVGEKNLKQHLVATFKSNCVEFPLCRNAAKRIWVILQNCWQMDPTSRPGMTDVIKRIARIRSVINPMTVARAPGYEFIPTTVTCKVSVAN